MDAIAGAVADQVAIPERIGCIAEQHGSRESIVAHHELAVGGCPWSSNKIVSAPSPSKSPAENTGTPDTLRLAAVAKAS